MIWTDNMLIPKGGDVFTASMFMDYVYDPKVAAQIEAYVNYICPVEGARRRSRRSTPALAVEPADLPGADDAREGQDLRRRRREQRGRTRRSSRP